MHKYQPRFHVVLDNQEKSTMTSALGASTEHVKTFVFPETQFMAVTAYQNHMVSRLRVNEFVPRRYCFVPLITDSWTFCYEWYLCLIVFLDYHLQFFPYEQFWNISKAKCMCNNFKDSTKYLLYFEISPIDLGQTSKISVNYRPRYVTNAYKLICICPQSEILKALIFAILFEGD